VIDQNCIIKESDIGVAVFYLRVGACVCVRACMCVLCCIYVLRYQDLGKQVYKTIADHAIC